MQAKHSKQSERTQGSESNNGESDKKICGLQDVKPRKIGWTISKDQRISKWQEIGQQAEELEICSRSPPFQANEWVQAEPWRLVVQAAGREDSQHPRVDSLQARVCWHYRANRRLVFNQASKILTMKWHKPGEPELIKFHFIFTRNMLTNKLTHISIRNFSNIINSSIIIKKLT